MYTVENIADAAVPAVVRKNSVPNPFTQLAQMAADDHAAGKVGAKQFDILLPLNDARDAEIAKILRLIGNAGRVAGISLNRRVDKQSKTAVTFRTWPTAKRERKVKGATA